MAKKDSMQKRLERVRPPRVQLTYDVQVGDVTEKKELPFVVGVLGEFSGTPDVNRPLPRLKERKFVSVDLDSLDDVMAGMSPRASFWVSNTLSPEGGEMPVELQFNAMDDFRPESVILQLEPLRRLLEARSKLSDLRNKLAAHHKLDDLLSEVLANTGQLERLGVEAKKLED